eukprot:10819254-Alexandrium_andersonii.AAC.1
MGPATPRFLNLANFRPRPRSATELSLDGALVARSFARTSLCRSSPSLQPEPRLQRLLVHQAR